MQKKMGLSENDIDDCLYILAGGGIILYPTDTIWGIGCDATNQMAVQRIFTLKQREDSKTMIMLLSAEMDITSYVTDPAPQILDYVANYPEPITAIYANGKNIAPGLISEDGTVAIRITKDEFCTALVNKLKKPLVSTSANISGKPAPTNFSNIDVQIKKGVDYIVQHRTSDSRIAKPSRIIKMDEQKNIVILRP